MFSNMLFKRLQLNNSLFWTFCPTAAVSPVFVFFISPNMLIFITYIKINLETLKLTSMNLKYNHLLSFEHKYAYTCKCTHSLTHSLIQSLCVNIPEKLMLIIQWKYPDYGEMPLGVNYRELAPSGIKTFPFISEDMPLCFDVSPTSDS